MTERQNTNLSDASHSSAATNPNTQSSMTVHPRESPHPGASPASNDQLSPRPEDEPPAGHTEGSTTQLMTDSGSESTPRPTNRSEVGESVPNSARDSTAPDDGRKRREQTVAGMPTAQDREARSPTISRPPSPSDTTVSHPSSARPDRVQSSPPVPAGTKRLLEEISGLRSTPGTSEAHRKKHRKFEDQCARCDTYGLCGVHLRAREAADDVDTTTEASEAQNQAQTDEARTGEDGDENIYDDSDDNAGSTPSGSPVDNPKTPNGDRAEPH